MDIVLRMEGRSKGREKDGGFELGLEEIIMMDYDFQKDIL